jgi:type I restriction enzyme M protein
MPRRSRNTEVHAYGFIRDELKTLGWDTRHPERVATGQVYTQNECLDHPEIRRYLGAERPENIIKIAESVFWVIEAKKEHHELAKALREAEEYAAAINASQNIKVLFVSGVAGNQVDSYRVQTRFLVGREFQPITINSKEVSALISPEIAQMVMTSGREIRDLPINLPLFLAKAEKINQILHLGAINRNARARVMAALLLSLIDDTPPNIDASPHVLINDINGRVKSVLGREKKAAFYKYIELALPPTEDNHLKFKKALVQTLQELNNLNIRSAMNSGTDVLGKFYEVFLKYGNGAKEIGIVLTPRHITEFSVDVISINDRDVVFDPACGTGGFLVAAFDYIRKYYNQQQVNHFKEYNLFGVDQDAEVVALAIVNMIFRGDGKNNIIEGSCFQKNVARGKNANAGYPKVPPTNDVGYSRIPPSKEEELAVTRVLMNPPFALKTSDEKEYKFVDQALKQMSDGGMLFSVLPYSAMVKPGGYRQWRESSLLKNHTLLCVITFPEDVFYPIGERTVGIFVKKGVPHPSDQNVLWIRAINDGLLKSKGKRLPNSRVPNDFSRIRDLVKAFLANPHHPVSNILKFQKACPIDLDDPLLELVPENYLDEDPPTVDEVGQGMEHILRGSMAFLISEGDRM